MSPRRPHAAIITTAIPALGAVLAAGCQDPQCGDSRSVELQEHGPRVVRAMRNGDPAQMLREIGVAIGLLPHTGTTIGAHSMGGAVSIATAVPPTPPAAGPMDVDGSTATVGTNPIATGFEGQRAVVSIAPASPTPRGAPRVMGHPHYVGPEPTHTIYHPPHRPVPIR